MRQIQTSGSGLIGVILQFTSAENRALLQLCACVSVFQVDPAMLISSSFSIQLNSEAIATEELGPLAVVESPDRDTRVMRSLPLFTCREHLASWCRTWFSSKRRKPK